MTFIDALNALGLGLLSYRLWPRSTPKSPLEPGSWPLVSIIIPARNEERTLPALLASLRALRYPHYEVLVLNDNSTDLTASVAEAHGVTVISGGPKPDGWFGKPWACHQGSEQAKGDYLLFTDADTVHEPDSLKNAIGALLQSKSQGLSATPYHLNPKFWERLLGPFQCFLLALTNPYGRPRRGRVFAIGQYLLLERGFYQRIGGHRAIRGEAVDDLSLAELTMAHGGHWGVYQGEPLFRVRMYESLKEFIAGWRRNFRGGFKLNSKLSGLEVTLYIMALTAAREPSLLSLAITSLSLIFLGIIQNRYGRFSFLGPLLFPFSLLLFTAVTALALFDQIFHKPLVWKNRSYPSSQVPNFPA